MVPSYVRSALRNGFEVSSHYGKNTVRYSFESNGKRKSPRAASQPSIEICQGQFKLSYEAKMFTRHVYTCTAIAARVSEVWGLYHDCVEASEVLARKQLTHDAVLLDFMKQLKHRRGEDGNVAFAFGNISHLTEKTKKSRREVVRYLIEEAGFKRRELVILWNNDNANDPSMDVYVDPIASAVTVEVS